MSRCRDDHHSTATFDCIQAHTTGAVQAQLTRMESRHYIQPRHHTVTLRGLQRYTVYEITLKLLQAKTINKAADIYYKCFSEAIRYEFSDAGDCP